MIETEQQRRWWFATHPEFSSRRSGKKHGSSRGRSDDDDKPSPQSVDAWADESLKYATDEGVIELINGAKKWFGTEFASKTPEEKEALLRGDEDDDAGGGQSGNDWWSQQPEAHETGAQEESDTYKALVDLLDRRQEEDHSRSEFIRKMMEAGWSREKAEERWEVYKLNKDVASGVATAMTIHGGIEGARGLLNAISRWAGRRGTAGSAGKSGEQSSPQSMTESDKIGEANQGVGAAKKAKELEGDNTGWKLGDDYLKPTLKGNQPAWTTQKTRYWKNEAAKEGAVEKWGYVNVQKMKGGNAPRRTDETTGLEESMELHHTPVPRRQGGTEVIEVWPPDHARIDPHRRLKKR